MSGPTLAGKVNDVVGRYLSKAFGPERRKSTLILFLFVALFCAHLPLLRPLLQNGDSAVYNRQIDDHDLTSRTTHVGYIALGIVFNRLLPFGTDLNMNAMALILGFLGLAAVYSTTKSLSQSRVAAFAASLLALGLSSQVRGMLLSEVDGVSVALVALAFAFFQRGVAFVAGLLFGLSVLVTPLSGPLLIVFVATAVTRGIAHSSVFRLQVRKLFSFGAGSMLVYVPVVLILYRDYVHGPRGLLNAPRASFNVSQRVLHSWHFIADELGYMLPLYAAGAIVCLLNRRLWRAGQPALALTVSLGLMAVVGERFLDVPVQLPNLVLFGMLPAVAFAVSPRLVRMGLGLLASAYFFNVRASYGKVEDELRVLERERDMCSAIGIQSAPGTAVLVGLSGWNQTRTCQRFASSPTQQAELVDWRRFATDQRRWLDPTRRVQIWFFRRVTGTQVKLLLDRYSLETRTVGSRTLSVLVPRPE